MTMTLLEELDLRRNDSYHTCATREHRTLIPVLVRYPFNGASQWTGVIPTDIVCYLSDCLREAGFAVVQNSPYLEPSKEDEHVFHLRPQRITVSVPATDQYDGIFYDFSVYSDGSVVVASHLLGNPKYRSALEIADEVLFQ